jgi:hypothetical protein
MVVVGNAVFISDWVLGGPQSQSDESAQRRALLASNLVDWLSRSPELIALRAKKYTNRTLVDEDYDDYLKEAKQRLKDGELTDEEYVEVLRKAGEDQERRWKRQRWFNIALPCGMILAAGLVVLLIRRLLRQSGALVVRRTDAAATVPEEPQP